MVTVEDAKEIVDVLIKEIQPVSVIAFGSVAKHGKGHDIDLLVVTEYGETYEEVGAALQDLCCRFAIDYFVASVDTVTKNFREGSPFLRLVQREGRVLYMKENFRDWDDLAVEDYEQAKYLFEGGFHRGACFHAQQSVEKGTKGELLRRGWDLERIHVIRRLMNIAIGFDLDLKYEASDIDFLDSIYRGRYPAEEGLLPLKAPSREDAERAIKIAEEILGQLGLLERDRESDK